MIKVTLGEKPQQESKPFPKLMIRKDAEDDYTIILATGMKNGEYVGVCIDTTYDGSTIGEYCECWNSDRFTDYNEPITIQNA